MNKFLKVAGLILLGIIFGIILTIIAIIGISISLVDSNRTIVYQNSYLILDFNGEIKEKPLRETIVPFERKREIELIKYLKSIEMAAYDPKIEGIVINGDMTFYSRVHAREIMSSIEKFKKSGKKVYAWLSNGINSNYYFVTIADYIYMPPTNSSFLSLNGSSISMPYLKDTFDKIGIEFNVFHIGKYKGAYENYSKNDISEELKQSYELLIKNINQDFIETIAKNRNIDKNIIKQRIANGDTIYMTPEKAKEYGFIDDMLSYEEMFEKIGKKDCKRISISSYSTLLKDKISQNKIAIIYVEGTITNYWTGSDRANGDMIGAKSFLKDIEEIKKDTSIKAIILRVNSPGGSALASELMLKGLNELKKSIPVYVSMGPIATSGGYYISSEAERIFASNTTITGSIGVVFMLVNVEKLTKNLGINYKTIKEYKYDDYLNPTRKATDEEVKIILNSMQKTYEEFINHVMKGRNISKDQISSIAEGRIWSGKEALKYKLIDEIGGLNEAIEYAVVKNEIKNYSIVLYPKPPSFWDEIMNGESNLFYSENIVDKISNNLYKKIKVFFNLYEKEKNIPYYILPFIEPIY